MLIALHALLASANRLHRRMFQAKTPPTVRWSRDINDDLVAEMTIEKIGNAGLRLRTTDKDPTTGRNTVASDIRVAR